MLYIYIKVLIGLSYSILLKQGCQYGKLVININVNDHAQIRNTTCNVFLQTKS